MTWFGFLGDFEKAKRREKFDVTMKISRSVPFIGSFPYLRCCDIEVVMSRHQLDSLSVSVQYRDIVVLMSRH